MTWPISDRLRDYLEVSYTLERVLGVGGMGCVLLATERMLERRVAIKVLRADAAGDTELRERFRREARTAARLNHANIVPLHTFGEVDGEMYFVMAFVDGETLAARLRRLGALDPGEVRRITAALADALDYAHGAGIVHRDIKPENVLIDESGRPLLTDFGIAREQTATSLTQTGVIVGTPHYMAPEQAAGDRQTDGRADIYSLGVVAYRAFSGRLPFGGETIQDVLRQHMVAEPAPVPAERAGLDAALTEIIGRALRKDPAGRWTTAREFGDALRSDDSDEALPEALVTIDASFGRMLWLMAVLCGVVALAPFYTGDATWGEVVKVIGAVAVFGAALPFFAAAIAARAAGVPFARAWALGWRTPKPWKSWWPARFRRSGDVWDRLPLELRFINSANDLMTWAALPVMAWGVVWVLSPPGRDAAVQFLTEAPRWLRGSTIGGAVLAELGILGAMAAAGWRLRKRHGLTGRTLRDLASMSLIDPRWRQAKFAQLLRPPGREPAGFPPGTASGDVAAIERLVRELARLGRALPDGLASAVKAAAHARSELAAEAERLRSEVDPQAIAALDRRIASLDGSPRDADVRALLASQRELMARIEQRVASVGERRLRLDEQMRLLHEQLIALRADGAASHDEITGRIREMSADLKRIGDAYGEADRAAGGATGGATAGATGRDSTSPGR